MNAVRQRSEVGCQSATGAMVFTCCLGDISGDGQVSVNDLLAVINAWGACPTPPAACPGDINGDLQVNSNDLLIVNNPWGPCPP